jgi:hypothetical protein
MGPRGRSGTRSPRLDWALSVRWSNLRIVSSPVWGRRAAVHEMVAGQSDNPCAGEHDREVQTVPRNSHEEPSRSSQPLSSRVRCIAPQLHSSKKAFPCKDTDDHDGWVRSALLAQSASLLQYQWPRWQRRVESTPRRFARQCFPRSRPKKLRLRCNCDWGTPTPTFGVLAGAAWALPASRVGADPCNWC